MTEVITSLKRLKCGQSYTAPDDDVLIIEPHNTYSDILRYVVSEIGDDARSLLDNILSEGVGG